MNKVLLIGFFLGALAVGVLFWLEPEAPERAERPAGPDPAVLTEISFKDYDDGRLVLEVWAERAEVYEEQEETRLLVVRGLVPPEQPGGEPTRFQSERALIEGAKEEVLLSGAVRIDLPQERQVSTEALRYRQAERHVLGDQPVRMLSPGQQVDAQGLSYYLDQPVLELERPQVELEL